MNTLDFFFTIVLGGFIIWLIFNKESQVNIDYLGEMMVLIWKFLFMLWVVASTVCIVSLPFVGLYWLFS